MVWLRGMSLLSLDGVVEVRPRPRPLCGEGVVGGRVVVVMIVVASPLDESMSVRVDRMVSCEMAALAMSLVKMHDKDGLERPFGKLTQTPMQFGKPLARVVVRVGSFNSSGGAGTLLMILLSLGLDIAKLVAVMFLRICLRDSFGIGSRCSVMGILEPPMRSDLFRSVQSSMKAAKRMSEMGLCVENASPTTLVFMSDRGTSLVEMRLATEWRSRILAMLGGMGFCGKVSLYVVLKARKISAASSRWVAVSSRLDLKKIVGSMPSMKN